MGPWDRRNGDKPFIGKTKKDERAEFYPESIAKDEISSWLAVHPEMKSAFTSYFTVIKRKGNGLIAVPYSEEYKTYLSAAAKLLEEAAALSDNASLKRYLNARAEAFMKNDYCRSDIDWMRLDSKIEPTIGPYEVYEDRFLGYKASFESFIGIKDGQESAKLGIYSEHLGKIDELLPVDKAYRFTKKSQKSYISVVDEVFAGGSANAGYTVAAFNLPNDERVRKTEGSKKVLLKNMMLERFRQMVVKISKKLIDESQHGMLNEESYFNFVLFHELSHGLGPAESIDSKGNAVPVNESLRELYSHLEEAKADMASIFCALYFIDNGILTKKAENEFYVIYLGVLFWTLRSGLNEAHAKGNAVIFNWLRKEGAIAYDGSKRRFSVDYAKFKKSFMGMLIELNNIQASGDYERALALTEKHGFMPKEISANLREIEDVPVDIKPFFKVA